VKYICRHSQQQIACLPVVPIGKQVQIRNVVVCHLSVGRCKYAFRSTPASGSPARCAPLPKPRISACSTFNSPKADRRPFKLPLQLGELPIEPAQAIHSRFDDDERRRKAAIDATRSEHFVQEIRRICKK
jgi:hypothetical protein